MPQFYVDYIKNNLKQSKIISISKCFTKYLKDSQWFFFFMTLLRNAELYCWLTWQTEQMGPISSNSGI